jgi:lysyl-tRNA synthetase, class II
MFKYDDVFRRTHTLAEFVNSFDNLVANQVMISVAGRITSKRKMGKVVFFFIQSIDGFAQGYVNRTENEAAFETIKSQTNVGDIIGIEGVPFLTKTKERSINITNAKILSRTERLFPDKFHGITDTEVKYRQRYLDLITNLDSVKVFRSRFNLLTEARNFLVKEGFTEVETPILQKIPGGASARPFITHHNSLDVDLYLRISPEIYLKQLIVGGFEKVFEIGKNFRNEGLDPSHLQEFTMLEFYVAYVDYKDNILFTRRLIQEVVEKCTGKLEFDFRGNMLDLSGNWRTLSFRDMLLEDTGIDILMINVVDELVEEIEKKNIEIDTEKASLGVLFDRLYKRMSRPKLIQPTILVGQPMALLPLARPNDDDSRFADAFQVIINGWEVVKAYSELADPNIQRSLLEEQAALRNSGEEEAMFIDKDFLDSLEYGMPPTSGVGIGIDRLTAIITGQYNLRDVVLFPTVR